VDQLFAWHEDWVRSRRSGDVDFLVTSSVPRATQSVESTKIGAHGPESTGGARGGSERQFLERLSGGDVFACIFVNVSKAKACTYSTAVSLYSLCDSRQAFENADRKFALLMAVEKVMRARPPRSRIATCRPLPDPY
jgi:hypothetical protein